MLVCKGLAPLADLSRRFDGSIALTNGDVTELAVRDIGHSVGYEARDIGFDG